MWLPTTKTNTNLFAADGNFSPVLLYAAMSVVAYNSCQSALIFYGGIDPSMLCTSSTNNTDTCQGDSGGPVVCPSGGVDYLAGIVSWGVGCAEGIPAVSTYVSHFSNAIDSAMADGVQNVCFVNSAPKFVNAFSLSLSLTKIINHPLSVLANGGWYTGGQFIAIKSNTSITSATTASSESSSGPVQSRSTATDAVSSTGAAINLSFSNATRAPICYTIGFPVTTNSTNSTSYLSFGSISVSITFTINATII